MAQTTLLQPLSIQARLSDWNLVRGIDNEYDVATEISGRTGFALPSSTPDDYEITSAGVLSISLEHLPDTALELDDLEITTDQGTLPLAMSFRDWFPDDSEDDLHWFYSAFRSVDGTARELWRGIYWYSETTTGDLDMSIDITVMSDDNGYLNLNALRDTLVETSQNGLVYVTRLTDQVGTDHLLVDEDRDNNEQVQAYAFSIINGSLSDFHERGDNLLFLRGHWDASDFNSNWQAPVARRTAQYLHLGTGYGEYFGISTVQQRFVSTTNRIFRYGDYNSYPGLRDAGIAFTYRYNARGVRPGLLATNAATWRDAHLVMMDCVKTATNLPRKHLDLVRLAEESNHVARQATAPSADDVHNGDGGEIEFGEWWWAEGSAYILPQLGTNALRTAAYNQWAATIANIANNLVSIFSNTDFNYSFTN